MRRLISLAALGLGLAAVSSTAAFAMAPVTVVAHIPFEFIVRGETLPAGDYRIARVSDLSTQVLKIATRDGRHTIFFMTEDGWPASRSTQPALVFDRYGTKEFLHAIRLPEETGAVLELSNSEIEAARELGR